MIILSIHVYKKHDALIAKRLISLKLISRALGWVSMPKPALSPPHARMSTCGHLVNWLRLLIRQIISIVAHLWIDPITTQAISIFRANVPLLPPSQMGSARRGIEGSWRSLPKHAGGDIFWRGRNWCRKGEQGRQRHLLCHQLWRRHFWTNWREKISD